MKSCAGRHRAAPSATGGLAWALALAVVLLALALTLPPPAAADPPRPRGKTGAAAGWEAIGLAGGGAMFAPAISPADPKLMMVNCDMSGAYISRDGGRTWRMIHHAQLQANTRCRPAFHPTDRKVVYAAGGGAGRLMVSRDTGETWQALGNLPDGLRGAIALDPERPDAMLAGVADAVWRSADAGRTWTRCDGPHGEAVGFAFGLLPGKGGARAAFAATADGVWRSTDGGATWTEKCRGLPERGLRSFAGGFPPQGKPGPGMLYCALPSRRVNGTFAGGVYASRDGGETWESAMGEGINREIARFDQWGMGDIAEYHHVLTTPARPLTVWAFNTNTGIPPPHHCAAYRSDDGGKNWRATFFPDPRWPGYNVEENYVTAGVHQAYQSVPNGVAICPSNPDLVLQLDEGNCHITADGGKTWFNGHCRAAAQKGFFSSTGLVVTTTWHHYVDPFEPARRYICYTDIGFARSLDAGASWHWWAEKEQAPWGNTCYELAFDPQVPGRIWGAFSNVHDIPNDNIISGRHNANGAGGVCVSADFGATWQRSNDGLPEAPCTSLVLDPTSPKGARTLYAGLFGRGLFVSTDDGKSWTERSRGLGGPANRRVCRVIRHADGTLFALVTALREGGRWVAEGPGLYRSKDKGNTWELIQRTQPLLWPRDFAVDPQDSRRILVGAVDADGKEQGGLWRTADGGASWARAARHGAGHFGAAFSPHRPGWIYATLNEGADGPALWLSRDGGATWAPFTELPFRNVQRVEFDPRDQGVVYVCTFGGSVWRGPAEP
ncbi:MAG: hypothetical protein HZA54_02645 [Planctomycetes bacterium]|nr:hypothetical protein [Planctomycetota bacterium]